MEFLPEEIENYALEHTSKEQTLLSELNRQTHINILQPRMLSGHLQGRILSTFSHMIRPKRILEIGTYTGYSALCLAESLDSSGKLFTIDINKELEPFTRSYIKKSQNEHKIEYLIGNALDIIPHLDEKWDLVFIDADKENYSNYFDLVLDKVVDGGFIIVDNVLWSGKVIESIDKKDDETLGIVAFNEKVHNDPRVENVLFPVRDGLMVVRKL